jgi:Rne/Rng family ribonuclease
MSKELVVSAGRHETRVAILEDDQVVELFHEREKEYSLAGSIHKGRVTRVLPGMQSAFVDIGLERDAFLYVSDFFEDNDEYEAVVSTVEEKVLKMERTGSSAPSLEAQPRNVLPAAETSGETAVIEIVSSGEGIGSPSIAVPAASAGPENRQDGSREGRGDRGGRGRRGRRRRGGRGSGLPDSKFFSPRNETETPQESRAETEAEIVEEPPTYSLRQPQADEDFMVLPGESLAKYSPGDSDETAEEEPTAVAFEPNEQPETAAVPEPVAESPVEAALPVEHPLAGFGEVSSWVNPVAADEAPAASSIIAPDPVQENEPVAAAVIETPDSEKSSGDDDGISASEVAEIEIAEAVRAAEFFEENGAASDNAELEPHTEEADSQEAQEALAEEGNALESGEETAQPVDDGPEPARIPTSLTATLREQGHRYPHRVSRRMRRKMRGGQNTEEGEKQPGEATGPRPEGRGDGRGENRSVSPRREDRGRDDRSREGREDRGREDRGREERGPSEARESQPREPREQRSGEQRSSEQRDRSAKERPERERPPLPSISDLLKEGQEIIVQIAKEPLGQKGARITSHIALPGRFVVYMPTVEHVGVSRKIPSDEERQRLKRILQTHRQGIPGGFICRTAAENKSEEELKSDMHFLYNLWLDMRQKAERKPAPLLLHHDLDLVQRILRDQLTTSFKTIWVDNEELYESILSFVQRFQPALVGRVKLYTRVNPIFDEFGVTAEIEKALRPKVWLKSGGYIVINQTEALVAIDINTGKYVGKSNRLEDTIVKINTDAIKEIVRQIRLRDLGGIIVVDFIDMDERKNRQKVMLALEDCMRADRAPYKILQFNDFGLVAITRKRVKQSLERTLCSPCNYCEGAGYIKSVGTVVSEILQEAHKMRKALESEQSNVMLRVNPEVAKVLKSNHNTYLQEIEETLGKTVLVKSDPQLHQTKFDLA